jgi:hypothetical protein
VHLLPTSLDGTVHALTRAEDCTTFSTPEYAPEISVLPSTLDPFLHLIFNDSSTGVPVHGLSSGFAPFPATAGSRSQAGVVDVILRTEVQLSFYSAGQ